MASNRDLLNVAHYRVLESIGVGGMGEVYLARDTKLDRHVAIKLLSDEFNRNPDRLHRFIQEARAASALNHPNILTIYEVGETEGKHYIATEFIEGETLRHCIQHQTLKTRDALDAIVQIASALAAAHQAGIIHRDIKPENVMLRPDGFAKVLDFGLAKLTEKQPVSTDTEAATVARRETDPGTIMGTVQYMSPEQARGKPVDARTDIFSLGVVLYEVIAGRVPFEGESSTDVLAAILEKEPAPLARFAPDVPAELQRIVNKSLRKSPDERYQTMRDFLLDLKELRDELALEEKLERSIRPTGGSAENQRTIIADADITGDVGRRTSGASMVQTTSSAEYLVSQIQQHKRGAIGVLLVLLCAVFGLGYFLLGNRVANTKSIESVAVLPFVNASGNADIEYLSDGMTETLIRSLSQLPNLNVKARSSVFRYKGKETDSKTIGKELNVQAVLNGRVVQRGEQLVLNLELIDAQTENVIWAEAYNRKQTDLVSLQSEIARDVSSKLKARLSGADEAKVSRTYTANPEAYQSYLKGRYHWNKRTAEDIQKATEHFKAAAEKDANYALAYSGLSDCYAVLPYYGGVRSNETIRQAISYAQRAVEIDDQLAEAHASLAYVNQGLWNWTDAEKGYKRAIELNPKYATAQLWYARFEARVLGRPNEGLARLKLTRELEPASLVSSDNLTQIYLHLGDVDSAFEQSKSTKELDPNFYAGYYYLTYVYIKRGQPADALAEAEKAVALTKRNNRTLMAMGYALAALGKRGQALAVAKELEERYYKSQADGLEVAVVYSGIGDKDQTFAWLEKAFQDHSSLLVDVRVEFPFASLHGDPRFKDLLKRMGMPVS